MTDSSATSASPAPSDSALLQLLSRLRRKGSFLKPAEVDGAEVYRLHVPGARRRREPAPMVGATIVAEAVRRDWLVGGEGFGQILRLGQQGALALARGELRPAKSAGEHDGGTAAATARRSRRREGGTVPRLRKLSGPDGKPLLDTVEAEAAERLAADFQRGRMAPRVTARWDASATADRRTRVPGPFGPEVALAAADAQDRVRAALAAVGGEFADLLLDVCGLDRGLAEIEKSRQWPRRSARLVLRMALRALARHYGMAQSDEVLGRRTRRWQADGYVPTLEAWFAGAPPTGEGNAAAEPTPPAP